MLGYQKNEERLDIFGSSTYMLNLEIFPFCNNLYETFM